MVIMQENEGDKRRYNLLSSVKSPKAVLLHKAIEEAFKSLGGTAGSAIVWHLRNEGFYLERGDSDINLLYACLQQILDKGTDVIMDMILQALCKECAINDARLSSEIPPIQKIAIILASIDSEALN